MMSHNSKFISGFSGKVKNPLFVYHECISFIFLVVFTLYLVFSILKVTRVIPLN